MTQKVAVAVVHGIGNQPPEFVEKMNAAIQKRCEETCSQDIIIRPVYWAAAMQSKEDRLWERLSEGGTLSFKNARRLTVDYVADALAYQPTEYDRRAYDDIHVEFAKALRVLGEEAGGEAPLCIIAHSLGTVISSNFIYDLQKPQLISEQVRAEMGDTPLDRGETLSLLYTMGSPLALWSLRFSDFGRPITVPSPYLENYYPTLESEWINYYDRDDLVAFPLKGLNDDYDKAVTADKEVNVGNILTSWNPLSHLEYWGDKDVVNPVADALMRTWKAVNPDVE